MNETQLDRLRIERYVNREDRDFTKEDVDVIVKAYENAVGVQQLKDVTMRMDSEFFSLQAHKMPEYQRALNALEIYSRAVGNKVRKLLQE